VIFDHCPADRDEVAEQYVMRYLSADDAAAFAAHLIACPACAQAAKDAAAYVNAVRNAAKVLLPTRSSKN
jgi:anti-sigma factor RsiW